MFGAPAVVDLELESVPESVTLVRATVGGLGSSLCLDPELMDDVQMAASEACNNVVLHAYGGRPGPLRVRLTATGGGIDVRVRDRGAGIGPMNDDYIDEHVTGLGLAVIRSLADRAEFRQLPEGGTDVYMRFERPIAALAGESPAEVDDGDLGIADEGHPAAVAVVARVAPVSLLPAIMARLTRALAAQARFSVERFSDLHLVLDSVVGHAQRAAAERGISFTVDAENRRLKLRIGPLRRRAAAGGQPADAQAVAPILRRLVDAVEIEPMAARRDAEVLSLIVSERGFATAI